MKSNLVSLSLRNIPDKETLFVLWVYDPLLLFSYVLIFSFSLFIKLSRSLFFYFPTFSYFHDIFKGVKFEM